MNPHLSDDQLLDVFYGIALDGDLDQHLDACQQCQARWAKMQLRREQSAPVAPPAEFFHRQRRGIFDRLARPQRSNVWVPATVAAALMVGLVITRTSPQPAAPEMKPESMSEASLIEAGWFDDTYSATLVLEPSAASPLRELFTEGPVRE